MNNCCSVGVVFLICFAFFILAVSSFLLSYEHWDKIVQPCSWVLVEVVDSWGPDCSEQAQFEQAGSQARLAGFIKWPGLQGLEHAVELSEDGLAGSWPLPWAHQPVLVWAHWAPQNLLKQWVVSEEEPEQAGSHPNLSSNVIHVTDKVHLKWGLLGADVAVDDTQLKHRYDLLVFL